jgi:hypothetical protein
MRFCEMHPSCSPALCVNRRGDDEMKSYGEEEIWRFPTFSLVPSSLHISHPRTCLISQLTLAARREKSIGQPSPESRATSGLLLTARGGKLKKADLP